MPPDMMTALATLVYALTAAVVALFGAMALWVKLQSDHNKTLAAKDDTQQTTIDGQQQKLDKQQDEIAALKQQQAECEAERKADRERFRGIALTCPVTRETCSLQQFFK